MVTPRIQQGFTYLAMLLGVAIMGATLALTGVTWQTVVQREKETDLLFVGGEFRRAIQKYYADHRLYPRQLADLLKDPSFPGTRRYLRKIYYDPVTGKKEWGILRTPDGSIMGIFSISDDAPLKTAGFALADLDFEGKGRYSDWQFVFLPPGAANTLPANPPK
jgi:type II secretory pathway pseudopilin PulG